MRRRCLAIGDPVGLPSTVEEVKFVVGCHSPDSLALMEPETTERELERMAEADELRGFDTIHIATHAAINDQCPEQCALVFCQPPPPSINSIIAGERIYTGCVTAGTIMREWRLSADLVCLSACETGLGHEVPGEGYMGFAQAFFCAGARSVLVGLWKVEDRPTFLLTRCFYENWLEGMSKSAALQAAKNWLRDWRDGNGKTSYEDPFYWAGFILIGDGG